MKTLSVNNRTVFTGVYYDSRCSRNPWRVTLRVSGVLVLQERFETLLDAAATVISARNKHGFDFSELR